MIHYPVVILGATLSGLTLAVSLAGVGIRVLVIYQKMAQNSLLPVFDSPFIKVGVPLPILFFDWIEAPLLGLCDKNKGEKRIQSLKGVLLSEDRMQLGMLDDAIQSGVTCALLTEPLKWVSSEQQLRFNEKQWLSYDLLIETQKGLLTQDLLVQQNSRCISKAIVKGLPTVVGIIDRFDTSFGSVSVLPGCHHQLVVTTSRNEVDFTKILNECYPGHRFILEQSHCQEYAFQENFTPFDLEQHLLQLVHLPHHFSIPWNCFSEIELLLARYSTNQIIQYVLSGQVSELLMINDYAQRFELERLKAKD